MLSPANSFYKPYILVVEDNLTTLSVYENILQSISGEFQLKCFSDARDALYFLEDELKVQRKVSAILLDLHMPYLDGWQFLDIIQQIKEFSNSPPLIWLCSADSSTYTFKQILKQAYVDRFIQKPVDWNQFKEFMDKASELKSKHLNNKPSKEQKSSQKSLFRLMKYSQRFSHYPKMKKKPTEQIILRVRSKSELEKEIQICLHKYEDPIYQALILMDFFYTLEEFIIKIKASTDAKKEALIRILLGYLSTLDNLWIKKRLHSNERSKSYYYRYRSEYELLEFRYLDST